MLESTRPILPVLCLCVRVKGVTAPRCMTDELLLDERVLRRIAVRDMPQRTQIRITYRKWFYPYEVTSHGL